MQLRVSVFEGLDQLPTAYRELLQRAGAQNFFLGLAWFETLAATALEADARLRIYGVERDGEPQAALVVRTPGARLGSIFRDQGVSANSLSGFTNFQTCEFAPVFAPDAGAPGELLRALMQHIANERPSWDWLDLNALPYDEKLYQSICEAFAAAGFTARRYSHFGNWYETISVSDYEEYLKLRDASDRKQFQNYARKRRKLEKEHATRLCMVSGNEANAEQVIADYLHVQAASWKEPDAFPNFTPHMLRAAAQCGALRAGLLYVDEMPVAGEIGIVHGGRATMIKTAYDERYREQSVGAIVIMHVLKHLIEVDRVREIDFGRDDQPYKKLWMPHRRERWGVVGYNPRTARGALGLTRRLGSEALQSAVAFAKPVVRPAYHRFASWIKSIGQRKTLVGTQAS